MRIVYAFALFFFSISSCLFAWKIRREGGLSVHIRKFVLGAVVAMVSCIVSSYSQVETLSLLSFGTYYAALSWLLVFFVQFILEYTYNSSKVINAVMRVFAVAVTVNAFLNVKFRHAFSVRELNWVTDGNRYLILVPGLWYIVFLGTGFVVLTSCAILLIVKTLENPRAYRPRYLVFVFMITSMMILISAFLVFNIPMDWSALFYTIFAVVAWYFATRFVKTLLTARTLGSIVDHMDTGLVIFENKDEPVYMNERGAAMLNVRLEEIPDLVEKYYGVRRVSKLEAGVREIEFSRYSEKYVYRVQYEKMIDESGAYNGGFFALRDITEEKEREWRDKYNSEHDRLTNLFLQEPFYENCVRILKDNPEEQFIMIRTETGVLDSIRSIYGKDIKDGVVAGLGSVIRRKCAGSGGVGGWLNDESFSLLLPVSAFTEKSMHDEISETLTDILGENAGVFRFRVGICPVEDRLLSPEMLSDRARTALGYIEENDGRLTVWYTEGMRQKEIRDSNLADSLLGAMSNGELQIYLQPILGAGGKGVIGAEASVRWNRDGKQLLPDDFLPLLNKNEQIVSLDRFVWEEAVKQLARWKSEGKPDRFINVNIARKDLYFLDVCSEITGLLKKYGVEPSGLHVVFHSDLMALEKLHLADLVCKLIETGIHVNLDNFGGYHTAPVFLKDIRVDGIRLARELVRGVESDAAGKALVKSIIDMGRNLGVSVYADGVETEREYRALSILGCDGYQGFFISEPILSADFEQCGFLK